MNTTAHIKFAREITLAIGGLSLLMAMFGGLIFYSNWVGKPQYPTPDLTSHFSEIDISSQDLETLKRNWHYLAQDLDSNINYVHATQEYTHQFLTGFAWFAVFFGSVCGTVLLYVHFILRQVSKKNVL